MIYLNNKEEDILLNKRFVYKISKTPSPIIDNLDPLSVDTDMLTQKVNKAAKRMISAAKKANETVNKPKKLDKKAFSQLQKKALKGGELAGKTSSVSVDAYSMKVIVEQYQKDGTKLSGKQQKSLLKEFKTGFIESKVVAMKEEIDQRTASRAARIDRSVINLTDLVKERANALALPHLNKDQRRELNDYFVASLKNARETYFS